MFRGVTTFLEALDQKAEKFAEQHETDVARSAQEKQRRQHEEVAKWDRMAKVDASVPRYSVASEDLPATPFHSPVPTTKRRDPSLTESLKKDPAPSSILPQQQLRGFPVKPQSFVGESAGAVESAFPGRRGGAQSAEHDTSSSDSHAQLQVAFAELHDDYQRVLRDFNDIKVQFDIVVGQKEDALNETASLRAQQLRDEEEVRAVRIEIARKEEETAALSRQLDAAFSTGEALRAELRTLRSVHATLSPPGDGLNSAARNEGVDASLIALQEMNAEWKEKYEAERTAHEATHQELRKLQSEHVRSAAASAHRDPSRDGSAVGYTQELQKQIESLARQLAEKQGSLERARSAAEEWRVKYDGSQQRLRDALAVPVAFPSQMEATRTPRGNATTQLGSLSTVVDVRLSQAEAQEQLHGELKHSRFYQQLMQQGDLGRRVAGVVSHLDRAAARAVRALRSNAALRVCLAAYFVTLHFWVMISWMVNVWLAEPTHHSSQSSTS